MLPESVWLPEIPGLPGATSAAVIALALAPLAWMLLFRTLWGADLRAAGSNPRFAEAVGIDASRRVLEAMALSGAIAGLAGALYVLGVGHRFEQNFSPGFGLIGLTVALLARLHPFGVVATAAFYALVLNGAAYMQIDTDVPRSLVGLLTGFLVLFMTARGRGAPRRLETRDAYGAAPQLDAGANDAAAALRVGHAHHQPRQHSQCRCRGNGLGGGVRRHRCRTGDGQ